MSAHTVNPKMNRVTVKPTINKPTAAPSVMGAIERDGKPSEGDIRLCAYQKWQAAGKPPGDGVTFWLQAERELLQISATHALR